MSKRDLFSLDRIHQYLKLQDSHSREDEETVEFYELNSAVLQAELRHVMKEELQIELLRVTVSEIKLSLKSSLNDHMRSYVTVLIERRGGIATMMERAGNELNANKPASRRDDIPLQGAATTATAARDAEEEEGMAMRAVLPQLIDIIFIFNLTFLTVREAAAAL
ncbi:uncharacterized protein BDCG_04662 [Blastomyces dermatitidis ER-3]|uniref:Uncharacterized protein n=1 Tax=Ajellomyces dermatitidis (strain ER-3 / ATCC MYA-2586) TaxID=559297 RepID=A0ABP2F2B9_AJEDR|nr:uncharacterized protein BDCG_04662 [Blastomyces dermatitidis ER-3]EEQ89542.2 hypothetical protein BDCG_04662 [Blastomyces dermatitidis ER-3]